MQLGCYQVHASFAHNARTGEIEVEWRLLDEYGDGLAEDAAAEVLAEMARLLRGGA